MLYGKRSAFHHDSRRCCSGAAALRTASVHIATDCDHSLTRNRERSVGKPQKHLDEKPPKIETTSLVPTICHEHWWLDKATAGRYQQAEATLGGVTVGRLPYVKFR